MKIDFIRSDGSRVAYLPEPNPHARGVARYVLHYRPAESRWHVERVTHVYNDAQKRFVVASQATLFASASYNEARADYERRKDEARTQALRVVP